MTVRVVLALLCAALVSILAACGGVQPIRDTSAKGIISSRPGTSTPKAGVGSIVYVYDDGSISTNGPIVKWEWNFGNGWEDCTETEGICSTHLDAPGQYVFHLRVTDSTGKKAQDKVKVLCEQGFDAPEVFLVLGVDESDAQVPGSRFRYHQWRWRTIAYDPEHEEIRESPTLAVSRVDDGDPDFDLLRVILSSGDPDFDFCGIDIDGDGVGDDLDFDGTDDDPSLRRVFVLPHVLEASGRCLSKSKEDVYVWKISSSSGKKTFKGHVTLLK